MALDYRQAAAVNARLELDLRIGAAFTRFQTMTLQNRVPEFKEAGTVISYGMHPTKLDKVKRFRIMPISDFGVCCGSMETS